MKDTSYKPNNKTEAYFDRLKQSNGLKDLLRLDGFDPRPDEEFDPAELARGTEIELEHTNNADIAKKIAKDHLEEARDYYEKLASLGL